MELCEWKHWEKGMYEPFESQNRQRNETVSKTRGRCLQIEDDAQSWLVSIPFQSSRKGSQMFENHALPFRHHGGPKQAMRGLINKQVVVNSMSDLFGEYNSLLFLVVYSGKRNNSELSSTRKNWLDALVTTKKTIAPGKGHSGSPLASVYAKCYFLDLLLVSTRYILAGWDPTGLCLLAKRQAPRNS